MKVDFASTPLRRLPGPLQRRRQERFSTFSWIASQYRHLEVLNHVTLIAAAVPLRGALGFASRIGGAHHQAIRPLGGRRPPRLPSAPGILSELRAEGCIAP